MRLILQTGPEAGKEFLLTKDVTTLGRSPTSGIVISDSQVSRHHAEIRREGENFVIADLGSTNGTFINEVRISAPQVLRDGDTVRVGNTSLSFRAVPVERPAVVRRGMGLWPAFLAGGAIVLIAIVVVFAWQVGPGLTPTPTTVPMIVTGTSTPTHTPTPTLPATSTLVPTPTSTSTPTPLPPSTPTPTSTATSPCPNPKVRITSPKMGARLSGKVEVRGTAAIDSFDYYKLEYGVGEVPSFWSLIGDIHDKPVTGNFLGTWDTDILPEEVYTLRLTVVDKRGNYPPPCDIRVVVER